MKFIRSFLVLILLFTLGACTQVYAQVSTRVAGLEKNVEYMSLLLKEHNLQIKEDSVTNLVDKTRRDFKTNTDERAKYGAEILRLEGDLYDIRNEIGMIESKINEIEQEFVISNLDSYTKPTQSINTAAKGETSNIKSPNIVYNGYLKSNLVEKEYNTLLDAQQKETAVVNYLKIFTNNHLSMQNIENQYKTIERAQVADSLYNKYRLLGALNDKISDSITSIWGVLFDNKSYAYSYLFDKINQHDVLTNYENDVAKVRQKKAEFEDGYASAMVAIYPSAKKLLLGYELKLAETVGLNEAADSLKKVLHSVDTLNLILPKIVIAERTFIDYQNITISARTPYSTAHPIPKCTIYPRGTVYRILLGSYTKAQSPVIFKGVSPIGSLINEEKRHCYYAGGYNTLDQAQTGIEELKRAGFKRPEIVVWENGLERNVTKENSMQPPSKSSGTLYRIEVGSSTSDLSEVVRGIISTQASGVDISRIANSESQEFEYTFIIGTFDSNSEATKIADAISAQDSGLKVSIAEIIN